MSSSARAILNYFVSAAFFSSGRVAAFLTLATATPSHELSHTAITQRAKASGFLWRSFASANLRNAVAKDINEHASKGTEGFFMSPKADVFALTPRAVKLVQSAPDYQAVREMLVGPC